jgi:hypothetical protein
MWKPMDMAQRTGERIVLAGPGGHVICGHWDDHAWLAGYEAKHTQSQREYCLQFPNGNWVLDNDEEVPEDWPINWMALPTHPNT